MYPFTHLDFREKPGRHPEGRLSQYLTGLTRRKVISMYHHFSFARI
jgi:hypothetical protein